jgi:hypothetical protein
MLLFAAWVSGYFKFCVASYWPLFIFIKCNRQSLQRSPHPIEVKSAVASVEISWTSLSSHLSFPVASFHLLFNTASPGQVAVFSS